MRRRLRQSPPFLPCAGILLIFPPLPPLSPLYPPIAFTPTKSAFLSNFFWSSTRQIRSPVSSFLSFLPRADRRNANAPTRFYGVYLKIKVLLQFFSFRSRFFIRVPFPLIGCTRPKAPCQPAARMEMVGVQTRVLIPTHPRLSWSAHASGRQTNRIQPPAALRTCQMFSRVGPISRLGTNTVLHWA